MSGPLGSSQWMYASGFEIEQSLRFDDNLSQVLERIPTEASNRRTFTQSVWFKLGNIGSSVRIFTAQDANGAPFYTIDVFQDALSDIRGIRVNSNISGDELMVISNGRLRDVAAWYHLVVAVDTTQGTNTNRCKIYLNGTQLTDLATATYPDQNYETACNSVIKHNVGAKGDLGGAFDGYMAEFHHIDGTALTPASFGETGDYGEWKPKKYAGSHGTNGFYLPFKHDYSVEGFSTSTYRGSGVSGKLVNGVGFQPDFTWIKPRSAADNHVLYDSVRGYKKQLKLNATDAEDTNNRLETKTDGFKITTTDANQNSASHTYVAWNWDMGSPKPKQFYIAGNTHLDTGQKKFGASSLQFDGTGDYVTSPNVNGADEDWNFLKSTSSTATVECFVRHSDSIGGDRVYVSATEGAYSNSWYFRAVNGGEVNFTAWDNGATTHSVRTGAGVVSQNTWHHVALVKNGTNFKIFIDGTDETDSGGTDTSTNSSEISELRIGDNGSGQLMVGYIDEIRISDTARYSSNFTPTGSAFSTDSNTKLLMHMDGPNNGLDLFDSAGIDVNTTGTIASNVKANTTYGQSVMSWIGTGATGTVGTGLSSDAEVVIVKGRTTTDNWSISTTVIDGSVDGTYINGTGILEDWSDRVDPSSSTSGAIGVYNWDDGNKADTPMIAYAFHSVTGYSKIDKYTGNGSSTGPTVTTGFKVGWVMIKQNANGDHWHIYDNMRSADGPGDDYLTANRNNAEAENHSQEIDFLDTGFQLKSSNTGTNGDGSVYFYMAFADNREYHVGIDQSGNNNDFNTESTTENARSLDTPSNNFCTMNSINDHALGTGTLEGGNNHIHFQASSTTGHIDGTMAVESGKWYWEIFYKDDSADSPAVGVKEAGNQSGTLQTYGLDDSGWQQDVGSVRLTSGGTVSKGTGSGASSIDTTPPAIVTGDIVSIALDMDNSTITYRVNNEAWGNSSGPTTDGITAAILPTSATPYVTGYNGDEVVMNFGADSSFNGTKTAQGFQDSNDIGDFFFEPPSGYLALCTKNLPEPSIKPRDYFNVSTWTGDGSEQEISGVGFQPDWVWLKNTSSNVSSGIYDAIRGATKEIDSDSVASETTLAQGLKSFDTDGFTLGTDASVGENTAGFVGYSWLAGGGAGSSNTDGSINTGSTTVSQEAGLAISTYTGNATSGATVGHGLGAVPEMVMVSNVNTNGGWNIYHTAWGNGKTGPLQSYEPVSTASNIWNDTTPTSSVFSLGNNGAVNGNNQTYVAYCIKSIPGYSKVGAYVGNGNDDGVFVNLGFRPMFILVKNLTEYKAYLIRDSKRSPLNPVNEGYHADLPNAQNANTAEYNVDFLSNGFKALNDDGVQNKAGITYAYWAYAETPFKYANAK